jgi:hypothetical protein
MVNIIIRARIANSFYAIPFSLPGIIKLDKKQIIAIKKIYSNSLITHQTWSPNYLMRCLEFKHSHQKMPILDVSGNTL